MKQAFLVPLALGLALQAPRVHAQAHSPSFVVTSGADTIAVESFTTAPAALTGSLRLPQQQAFARYVIHLRPDGSVAEADVMDDAPNFFSGTITFDERAAVDIRSGNVRRRFVMAPASTYPMVGTSMALMEELARVTHAMTRDSTSAHVFNIRNRILGVASMKRLRGDSLEIDCEGCQRAGSHQAIHVGVAANGDFTGGVELEQGWVIVRR